MARDRIYISEGNKALISDLKKEDVLGLKLSEGKESFLLAVALGLNEPSGLGHKDGLFLNTAVKAADKALIASVLLGTINDSDDIDGYANFDKSADLCEQCAETGYKILHKKYNNASCDNVLLERRMLTDLNKLYVKNV